MALINRATAAARALARLIVQPADAHCDTEDGPAVTDGRRALASGNINHALKWVRAGSEEEMRRAFEAARVLVDGQPLDEPYAGPSIYHGQFRVPDGAYLLLGDNRDASHDSRIWADPYVPRRHLKGRLYPVAP